MCNLYSIRTSRAALAREFVLSDNRMAAFEPLPAIFPGHMAPIIKQSADGERELVMRSWGFILLRDGYAPKRVTNTRDDKVETKFWTDSFAHRRCLVPATAFCEPDEGKPARWHWFALKADEPRPLRDGARVNVLVYNQVVAMPAMIVLGFWIVLQLFSGFGSIAATSQTADQGGVAYMAHVGGFVAGLALTFLFRGGRDSSRAA